MSYKFGHIFYKLIIRKMPYIHSVFVKNQFQELIQWEMKNIRCGQENGDEKIFSLCVTYFLGDQINVYAYSTNISFI